MGIAIARIGDSVTGYCSCNSGHQGNYDGIIISGSSNVFSEGLGTAFISATVLSNCGHTSIIVSGSPSVFINGLGAGFIGSTVSGSCYNGTVVSGAGSVFSG